MDVSQDYPDWQTQPDYMPSPEDIERETAKIQEGWSDNDRENRRVTPVCYWSVPVCNFLDFLPSNSAYLIEEGQ